MKLTKTIAMIAAAGLLSMTPSVRAQTNTPPAGGAQRPGGGGGGGGGARMTPEERLAAIDEAVKLTAEQKPKVKAVIEDEAKKMADLRTAETDPAARREKMAPIREATQAKLKEILTPEQFGKLPAAPAGRGQGGGGGGQGGGGARRGTNAPAGGQ